MQVLGVVGVDEDEPADVHVDSPGGLPGGEVGQLADDDVDEHVDVVGVEQLVAGLVQEHVHHDLKIRERENCCFSSIPLLLLVVVQKSFLLR